MPEARQNNSKLAEMLAKASNFRTLGSRRATPLRLFQHPPGHRHRGCQTAIVWSIRLSLAAPGIFMEGQTVYSPQRLGVARALDKQACEKDTARYRRVLRRSRFEHRPRLPTERRSTN
jgi:hypothetical protein